MLNKFTPPDTYSVQAPSGGVTDGGYGKDITVGADMILANVSVFTPKPSKHYLNITMRNVVRIFRKDTVPTSGSG
ncbi:GPCR kinase [Tanacetum coccineum]